MNIKRINAVFFKHFYSTKRNPERWVDIFYWPFCTLLFWWLTSRFLAQNSGIIAVVVGAIMLWAVFYRSQLDINTYLLDDFDALSQVNMYSSPFFNIPKSKGMLMAGVIRIITGVSPSI